MDGEGYKEKGEQLEEGGYFEYGHSTLHILQFNQCGTISISAKVIQPSCL